MNTELQSQLQTHRKPFYENSAAFAFLRWDEFVNHPDKQAFNIQRRTRNGDAV
jgi:hypothetical protein